MDLDSVCVLGRNNPTHTGFPSPTSPFFSPFHIQVQTLFCRSNVGLWPVFGFDEIPA